MLKLEDGSTEPENSEEDFEVGGVGDAKEFTEGMFSEMDADGDRQINVEEMANYLISKEGKTKHDEHFDTYTMVGEIFQEEDKNKDGVLSYDEVIGQASKHDEL